MSAARHYSPIDQLLIKADEALTTVFGKPSGTGRASPALGQPEGDLDDHERRESEALMRVNHVGEVCAQALYQAQAVTSRNPLVRDRMHHAAEEENDHLNWCAERIDELGGRRSLLNPLWYGGSFAIGAIAGLAGDRWNLGFVAETERQVVEHLTGHLNRLPAGDLRSRAIVEQMRSDEAEHATMAMSAGAADLPQPVRSLMRLASNIMTRTAHRL
jgi:3-demethoxyubiquinol 3-hydroxylase